MKLFALVVCATAVLATACSFGGGGGGSPTGVATNPADLPSGGALHNASPSPGGTPTAQTSGVRTVLAPLGLNLRASASATAQVLGTVAQGTVLTVIGYDATGTGWYRVKGDTTAGWITANPQFSSPHHFSVYQSPQRGFNALYLEDWTFSENPNSVVFRPQTSGGQAIVVQNGANLDALGPAGRDGYTLVSTGSAEVFGVTGVLRTYNRTGTVASPGPDTPPPLTHLAEIRLTIDSSRAMRLDFAYDNAADLQEFTDFYNSVAFPPPATPGPSGSPGASPAASPTPTPTL
jgi:SH3 domain-containing protein